MIRRALLVLLSSVILGLATPAWAQQTWTVNFKDSDIQEVIKFVADVTGKTIVIDPRVKGRVKVISAKPLDREQLLELFRSVLEVHDFTSIEVGNVLRIVPLKDARSSPLPVTNKEDEKVGYVTEVIQLRNIAAAKVLPVLRPLVPQHSHLAAYDPSNAIVISDSEENISRLRDLIERIDKAAVPTTEVLQLRYADAQDLVATLTKLERAEKKGSSANELQLVADKRNNAVLISGEDLNRERIKKLIKRLDQPQQQSGNVRVIYLEYADAEQVAGVLSKVVQNMAKLSPGGGDSKQTGATVEADKDTNSLLITASVDVQQSLLQVVEKLDIRRAQVLVEAIIVELSDQVGHELGLEWLFLNSDKGLVGSSARGGGPLAQVGSLASNSSSSSSDLDLEDAIDNLALSLGGVAGQTLGILGSNGDESFVALARALDSNSDANILSTPSLLTMDNKEATISVGENVPFRTGEFSSTGSGSTNPGNPFTTIQRQDVGITLTVTPQVNEGDKVLLDISQEVSSLLPSAEAFGASDVITSQRKIETQVLATDGEIVVLGGLIEDRIRQEEQRVPLLSNIPLLGNLFRSRGSTLEKRNLYVFIRATIVRDDETLSGSTAEKYQYIREQQIEQNKRGVFRMDDKFLPVLPELIDEPRMPDNNSESLPEANLDEVLP